MRRFRSVSRNGPRRGLFRFGRDGGEVAVLSAPSTGFNFALRAAMMAARRSAASPASTASAFARTFSNATIVSRYACRASANFISLSTFTAYSAPVSAAVSKGCKGFPDRSFDGPPAPLCLASGDFPRELGPLLRDNEGCGGADFVLCDALFGMEGLCG